MITEIIGECSYENCNKPATKIACGRSGHGFRSGHPHPAIYCDEHAETIADEGFPEYTHACPNCGCISGVN